MRNLLAVFLLLISFLASAETAPAVIQVDVSVSGVDVAARELTAAGNNLAEAINNLSDTQNLNEQDIAKLNELAGLFAELVSSVNDVLIGVKQPVNEIAADTSQIINDELVSPAISQMKSAVTWMLLGVLLVLILVGLYLYFFVVKPAKNAVQGAALAMQALSESLDTAAEALAVMQQGALVAPVKDIGSLEKQPE